ncbi:hypothetical protein GobsT_62150 [Gemmata obscuriglobus]|nr:hypothetical protein GobsT_62150 [Gemmata obscuriglobus]VTS10734.1 unnamed protein product [Gemmata obscuriglobus UQM 2246]
MDDLSRFCCRNAGCPDHGKWDHGNLTVPTGTDRTVLGCCGAPRARPGSPSARARPCTASGYPPTRWCRCWPTWPRAPVRARPLGWSEYTGTRSPDISVRPASTPSRSTMSWWPFPLRTNSNSMRSGASWPARRRTAGRTSGAAGTAGTTWPWTRSTDWWWASEPRTRPTRWCGRASADRQAGPAAHHHGRVPGVRIGHPRGVRPVGHPTTDRAPGAHAEGSGGATGGTRVRDRAQGA